jgi:hypothetical protein
VIAHTANYKLGDKGQGPAFHQGQIYVRHSSKSEPATEDDVRWMINKAVSRVLASLSEAMKNASISVAVRSVLQKEGFLSFRPRLR